MKNIVQIIFILFIAFNANAQDSIILLKKLTISGYVKDLQTFNFNNNFKELISGNLIHNRINVKWEPSEKVTFAAEFRNRLFWGEEVKHTPGFTSLLRNNNEKFNLQKVWIQDSSLVLHTSAERLYVDYRGVDWNARVGRQRINWGITTTWNPNDIFNAYNFLDFDYEELPGIDGGKFQYLFNDLFNVEIAYALSRQHDGNIAALKYNLNKWGYDMQMITGWYNEHVTLGGGWAGNIKDAGFKGEVQYFFRDKDSADHLNASLEGDYMFKKGWYLNFGFLFNNHGLYKPVPDWNTINLKLTPENLMPTKLNFITTLSKVFTPLFSGKMSILYAPGTNLFMLLPSLQYDVSTNLDFNFFWQSFFTQIDDSIEAVNHRCFLRIKWSF